MNLGVVLRSGSALPPDNARSLPIDPLGDMLRVGAKISSGIRYVGSMV